MTEARDTDNPSDDETNNLSILPALAFGVGLGTVFAYLVFFGIWKRLPAGGPSAWAEFGDYYGGLVNPVAGVITVFLVFFTLKATRKEARKTRGEMQKQLKQLVDAQILTDLHRRIEGIYGIWKATLERRLDVQLIELMVGGNRVAHPMSLAWVFENVDYAELFQGDQWEIRQEDRDPFDDAMIGAAAVVREIDVSLQAYDSLSPGFHLTDFYRLRMLKAASMLCDLKLVAPVLRDRFDAAGARLKALTIPPTERESQVVADASPAPADATR